MEAFRQVPKPCPKCSGTAKIDRYARAEAFVLDESGKIQARMRRYDGSHKECLIVQCSQCGYEWTMETR